MTEQKEMREKQVIDVALERNYSFLRYADESDYYDITDIYHKIEESDRFQTENDVASRLHILQEGEDINGVPVLVALEMDGDLVAGDRIYLYTDEQIDAINEQGVWIDPYSDMEKVSLAEALLQDEMIEDISQQDLTFYMCQSAFNDVPQNSRVDVTANGEPVIVVYRNNGQLPFDKGDNLDEIILHDDCFTGSDNFDWEEIEKRYTSPNGYATFIGFYRVVLTPDERIESLLEEANVSDTDVERKALFYIIGNVGKFFRLRRSIYDFEKGIIKPEVLDGEDFSRTEKGLLTLAFDLYNGNVEPYRITDFLNYCSPDYIDMVIEAIQIRYKRA